MKNFVYYRNIGLCETCKRGHCEIDNFPCDVCKMSFPCEAECPCEVEVEDKVKFCKFYEMNFPKDEIFESIKRGFKAYLIGRYGTQKEKHEYVKDNINISNHPKREEIKRGFKAYLNGKYGTQKEKHEYAEDNMNMSSPKREEIKAMLNYMLCKIMYEMGDFENEN